MVQVIENATSIDGIVRGRTRHPTLPGWDLLTVELAATRPVAGKADLLSSRAGSAVEIAVAPGLLPAGELAGWRLRCTASVAGPGVIRAEKDPAPGAFEVSPPR